MLFSAIAGVVVLLAAVFALNALTGGDEANESSPVAGSDVIETTAPPAAAPAGLPESTTHTTIDGAPLDPDPAEPTDGTVVHPRAEVPVSAEPAGPPIARIGPQQIGDTWLPVIAEQPGWVQVLLPSRPNSSVGWIPDAELDRAVTPYLIRVHLQSLTMELIRDGVTVGEWTVGTGTEADPTPPGRTFLLGSFTDSQQDYSPVILPLGTHSPTLDTFGGGPGTVAIHTWPTDDVFGTRSSNGCIRVPQDALDQLTEVPLGTLVLIDEL